MTKPRISVVLPVFNGGAWLAAAVESILGQTCSDFELIAIDDGSTDGTGVVLHGFAARDDRVVVVSRENRGLIATLNEGIERARGDYIARMDADDVSHPERFARQVERLDGLPDLVAVGCRARMVDPDGAPIMLLPNRTSHEEIEEALLLGRGGMPHPGTMFRTEAARRIGGYRAEFPAAEDVDFFLRLGEIGRLASLSDVLLDYRVHLGSESRKRTEEQRESGRRAANEARARRGLPPLPEAARPDGDAAEGSAGEDGPSAADHHRKWARWALKAGEVRTARKHAVTALRLEPFRRISWRLFRWSIRGY